MKKSVFFGYILFAILFSACATAKKPTGNAIITLEFSRGACFGKCPVYSIKLYNTGLVRYTGTSFVKYQGVYEKKFKKADIQKLLDEAAAYHIDTCQEKYMYVPDMPGIDYTITYKNKTKKIQNAHRGPEFLRQLATDIDSAVKVDGNWKKIAAKTTDPRNP